MFFNLMIVAFILNHPFYTFLIILAISFLIVLPQIYEEL